MKPLVLCVDDDLSVLEGYRRVLGMRFEIYLARGPWQGLMKLESGLDFSVVIADKFMPDMDGTEFLRRVRQRAPETARIMLSGDLSAGGEVTGAEGGAFSFLNKPCSAEKLLQTVEEGVRYWASRQEGRFERRKYAQACVEALLGMLSTADPDCGRRSRRIRDSALVVLRATGREPDWQMEAALALGQAGCLGLPKALLARLDAGEQLSDQERELFESHPNRAKAWIAAIPDMEAVAEAVTLQRRAYGSAGKVGGHSVLPLESRLLKLAADMDYFSGGGRAKSRGISRIKASAGDYDPELVGALERVEGFGGEPCEAAPKALASDEVLQ
jgi:CheY-like chemotaxis protein